MNSFSTWFEENKLAGSLAALFILLLAGSGWWAYRCWDDYATATRGYEEASNNLGKLNKRIPFPNDANKARLEANLKTERQNLSTLVKTLQAYNASSFGDLEQAKPQDRPQLFQDALRAQVSKIKTLASSRGVTLPAGFYLGMEEFENRLPSSEEVLQLSKQLSALTWLAENLASNNALIIAEFTRVQVTSPARKDATKKPPAPSPDKGPTNAPLGTYENLGVVRTSFRCDQQVLRELVNTISAAPYFFILEGLQLQNTSAEPPHRDHNAEPATPQAGDGRASIEKIPFLVGLEQLNVSMKLKVLQFPVAPDPAPTPQTQGGKKQ